MTHPQWLYDNLVLSPKEIPSTSMFSCLLDGNLIAYCLEKSPTFLQQAARVLDHVFSTNTTNDRGGSFLSCISFCSLPNFFTLVLKSLIWYRTRLQQSKLLSITDLTVYWKSSMLRDCHVCIVSVLMSPFEIRADLLFSLLLDLSLIGMVSCCAWLEREWERGRVSGSFWQSLHCISLIKTSSSSSQNLHLPLHKTTHFIRTSGNLRVCMSDDFSRWSLGCYFFLSWRNRTDIKNRPADQIKMLRVKTCFAPSFTTSAYTSPSNYNTRRGTPAPISVNTDR